MRTNVLPNEEYYYFDYDVDITKRHTEVMEVIKRYLKQKTSAEGGELGTIFNDIEKFKNFVCRFDDYQEVVRNGTEGKRVAYGAFRHSAVVHSTQTSWSYTYEILDTGDQYYMVLDTWGWMYDDDLRENVSQFLE